MLLPLLGSPDPPLSLRTGLWFAATVFFFCFLPPSCFPPPRGRQCSSFRSPFLLCRAVCPSPPPPVLLGGLSFPPLPPFFSSSFSFFFLFFSFFFLSFSFSLFLSFFFTPSPLFLRFLRPFPVPTLAHLQPRSEFLAQLFSSSLSASALLASHGSGPPPVSPPGSAHGLASCRKEY